MLIGVAFLLVEWTPVSVYLAVYWSAAYFGVRFLGRPHVLLDGEAVRIRWMLARFDIPYSDFAQAVVANHPEPKRWQKVIALLMGGFLLRRRMPSIFFQTPRYYVTPLLVPPIPLIWRTKCLRLPIFDEEADQFVSALNERLPLAQPTET